MHSSVTDKALSGNSKLIGEIERYLEAVEVFRREGCTPHWSSVEVYVAELSLACAGRHTVG